MLIGSMCTGYGGLDIAVQQVLGGELAWVADPDPGASAILAHHHPETPNLGDIRTADWSSVPPVDVLTAGFPCQPVSLAGRNAGTDDERWLFDDITTAISRMEPRPRLLLFENVPGLLTTGNGHAMARVIQGVAALGYVGTYRTLRASDIGAPHRRERVFILARRDTDPEQFGFRRVGPEPELPESRRPPNQTGGLGKRSTTANPERGSVQRRRNRGDVDRPQHRPGQSVLPAVVHRPTTPANATGDGRHQGQPEPAGEQRGPDVAERGHLNWGAYAPAIARWEHATGRPAPAPTQLSRTGTPVLAAPFVEWLMGLDVGHVTEVPGLARTAQLHALGNGVIPQQAAHAIADLLDTDQTTTEDA